MARRRWRHRLAGLGVAVMTATPATPAGALSTYQYVRADGFVASSPSLAATPGGELFIAVRGSDDGIYVARSIFNGAEWTMWETVGAPPGGAKGDPSLVSPFAGNLQLFVRGADDKLWVRSRDASLAWGTWLRIDDGALKGSPKASVRRPGTVDIFVLGIDDRVYQRAGDWANRVGPPVLHR